MAVLLDLIDSKHWATQLLLRRGQKRQGKVGLGNVGMGRRGGRAVMVRDSGCRAVWCGWVGQDRTGRSHVGLGVAGWLDGAGKGCTMWGATARLAEPPSSRSNSLLVSSCRVGSSRSSHGGRNFTVEETVIHLNFEKLS